MIEPKTLGGGSQPERLNRVEAARYMSEKIGIPFTPKALERWAARRKGPKIEYFGVKPLYRVEEIDRWLAEDAFHDKTTRRQPGRGQKAKPA